MHYFDQLLTDSEFVSPNRPALQALPVDAVDLMERFRSLPATKALAPDGLPAIAWKTLAPDVAPLCRSLLDHWSVENPLPPEPDGYTC